MTSRESICSGWLQLKHDRFHSPLPIFVAHGYALSSPFLGSEQACFPIFFSCLMSAMLHVVAFYSVCVCTGVGGRFARHHTARL